MLCCTCTVLVGVGEEYRAANGIWPQLGGATHDRLRETASRVGSEFSLLFFLNLSYKGTQQRCHRFSMFLRVANSVKKVESRGAGVALRVQRKAMRNETSL